MSNRQQKGPLLPERIVDPRTLPYATPRSRGNLPHLSKEGCTYFVTFCLLDAAVPGNSGREDPDPRDGEIDLAKKNDPAADVGGCLLRKPELASIVEDALLFFQGERYAVSAWCIMPNHVHAVVTPYEGWNLPKLLHSWKSFSAHEINKRTGRRGTLWAEEAFDHVVRNEESFVRFSEYTEQNPVKSGFCERAEEWPFSSARYR